jgi:hypothetical protein
LWLPHLTYLNLCQFCFCEEMYGNNPCAEEDLIKKNCNCVMTNVMHKFSVYVYLFTSALRVLGFLLTHFQRHGYKFGSGSSLLDMVSTPRQGADTIPCISYRSPRSERCHQIALFLVLNCHLHILILCMCVFSWC